jgi:putative tryptophan/tyrosine transport system substrate-binding protein
VSSQKTGENSVLIKLVVCLLLTVFLLTVVEAQQPAKVSRIGFLSSGSLASSAPLAEAFRKGLRELGYVEGKNIIIEYRDGKGRLDRLPGLAADLVRLNVDIIVTGGRPSTRAAQQATSTIPIVMAASGNPVGNRFVASLARPGGNITGLTTIRGDLTGKRLELLQEAVSKISRVAVLWGPPAASNFKDAEAAARLLGLEFQSLEVRSPGDLEGAFQAATKERAQALVALRNPVIFNQRKRIVELAMKSRLPAIYDDREFVEAGGLMSYGTNQADLYRRAATYVDKILKGAKPADLPVEQPTKFEFVINLKTAKQIGLTIPPNVLARADRVIR